MTGTIRQTKPLTKFDNLGTSNKCCLAYAALNCRIHLILNTQVLDMASLQKESLS